MIVTFLSDNRAVACPEAVNLVRHQDTSLGLGMLMSVPYLRCVAMGPRKTSLSKVHSSC